MNESTAAVNTAFRPVEYERLPTHVYVLGAVMVFVGLATLALMSTPAAQNGSYAYLFLYSIPANTAISVFPNEPVLIFYGEFANLWISAATATGATLLAGYLDHRVFVPVLNHQKITSYKENGVYRKAVRYFARYPFATLSVTAFLPMPFFPLKFLCFSTHYPLSRYLAALAIARYPKYLLLVWVGSAFAIPKWVLLGSVAVIFALYAVKGGPRVWRKWRARQLANRA